ncbi:MAG: hypothetical protein KAQ92_06815 [Candidatus Aenigmarchaeota archaeon]|nr:hypothetical protein [Candidatus Aenigmarchaeota archaeon]
MEKNKYMLEENKLPYNLLFDIFEKSPVAITVVDKDGLIITCNKFSHIIYGEQKKTCAKSMFLFYIQKKNGKN